MNTDNDIQLHELEALEQRLNTEVGLGAADQEHSAATSGRSFAIAPGSGFEAA
jgi:hypothetical protein